MKVSLIVLTPGKSKGQAVPVNLAQFVIGRDPQCNLRPGSALISKRHCAVLIKGDEVFVRDFDSTNGTFLNDKPLKGEVAVKHDDVLKVGPLEFRLAIEQTPNLPASKTPTPARSSPKKPTPPAPTKEDFHEDAAALLLGLDDETSETTGEMAVPGGSTVMDVPIDAATGAPPAEAAEGKPAEEKKKPIPVGTAQSAAKAILDKYNRRSR
jgi:pSer/pThr/pTyr-binding forkhead associated (FHA) protein